MYLLAAVQLTSLAMKRIPRRWWKRVHMSSFLLFWTAVVHGLTAGTDASNIAYLATTIAMTCAVVFLTAYRTIVSRRTRRSRPERRARVAVG